MYFSIISSFSIIFAFSSLHLIILGLFVTYTTNFRSIRCCCHIHVIFKLEYIMHHAWVLHRHYHQQPQLWLHLIFWYTKILIVGNILIAPTASNKSQCQSIAWYIMHYSLHYPHRRVHPFLFEPPRNFMHMRLQPQDRRRCVRINFTSTSAGVSDALLSSSSTRSSMLRRDHGHKNAQVSISIGCYPHTSHENSVNESDNFTFEFTLDS